MSMLVVNDLRFEVRRSDRRRSLQITVDRGGELIVSAPPEVPNARLRDFVKRKRMWVYKQLARSAQWCKAVVIVGIDDPVDGCSSLAHVLGGRGAGESCRGNDTGGLAASVGLPQVHTAFP